MKRIYLLFLLLIIPINVYADEAVNISASSEYKINNSKVLKLNDDNFKTSAVLKPNQELTIESSEKISHLYILYNISSKEGTITTENEEQSLGKDGFLHEYVELKVPTNKVTITYKEEVKIDDLYVYTEGDVPKDVQRWRKETSTDLMIFSTHADDEQLFFAGVMPTYINQGKKVHVVYLARHDVGSYFNPSRMHEQLNGLWTLGVTDYPTFGLIPDAYSTSLEVAEKQMNDAGFTDDDVIKFDVREIRKYKPKVILGHDENGEYGHGQHRLNTFKLKQAITKAEDASYEVDNLDSVKIYKVYLHLYDPDNSTVLDYDIALENYDNKTAYQVSKEGYSKHLSQQYTWFTDWLNGKNNSYTSATQIIKYNPAYWGLYYTSVGPDINKDDLFENIPEEKKDEPKEEENKPKEKKNNVDKAVNNVNKYLNKIKKYKDIIIIGCIFIIVVVIGLLCIRKKKGKN